MKTVGQLVKELRKAFPDGRVEDRTDPRAPKEAKLLRLDSTKAKTLLGWAPRWNFARTIKETAQWYKQVAAGASPLDLTQRQIAAFLED